MNIVISNYSDEPIYEQITAQIKDHIVKGVLIEADLLPSIRSLAKELKISVIITTRAYEELEKEGFKDFTLDNISLTLDRGFIMGFIEPNGAGKSTTIKLIMNLMNKDGGEIKIFGKDNIKHDIEVKTIIL